MENKIPIQAMGFLGVMGVLVVVLTVGTVTVAEAVPFTAQMDSLQEVAPGGQSNSPLTGFGDLQLTQGGGVSSLSFNINFDSGFDFQNFGATNPAGGELVTALHFHNNVRGANGGIVFGIFGPSSDLDGDTMAMVNANGTTTVTGEWDLTEGNAGATLADFVTALVNSQPGEDVPLYLNLHSENDPAGVIRGQLVNAVPEPGTFLLLGTGLGALGLWRWKQGKNRNT